MSRKPELKPRRNVLTWVIPVTAVAVLGGFLAGERVGGRAPATDGASAPIADLARGGAAAGSAAESPQERASRLYDAVMRFGESHRYDSVQVYAPKALQAYAALGVLDAHTHYDVGMIWAVVGDSVRGRSEAASILNERPNHLLGLLLAMRTASTPLSKSTFERRFIAAAKAELVNPLPEYDEHRHDIDGALRTAEAAKK